MPERALGLTRRRLPTYHPCTDVAIYQNLYGYVMKWLDSGLGGCVVPSRPFS